MAKNQILKEYFMAGIITKLFVLFSLTLPMLLNAFQTEQKIFAFDTPWLGVEIHDVSEKTLKSMGLDNGVIIAKIYNNSPAEKANLEIDDIIVTFDGEKVESPKDLSAQIKMKKVNDEVELEYFREGKIQSVDVKIEKRKVPQLFNKKTPHILKKKFQHSKNSVFLGVRVEPLTDQLREYFDVSKGNGVLVSEVIKDSPAEKAGLKAGDVITKIADREVKNYGDLTRGLNYFDPNDEVEVYFVRDKSKKSLKVILAKPQDKFEKMKWIDDDDFIHDFEFDMDEIEDIIEEGEIEKNLDGFNKKIEIKKEFRNKDEA